MANNKGKDFELKFKKDFEKSFPDGTIDRIYDTTNGYKTISNISDFIGYSYPCIMYLECKSHLGNTWNWSYFTQYDKLCKKIGIKGVIAGAVLWMIDHDVVVFLPVATVKKMKEDGLKSFNVNMIKDKKYDFLVLPSEKKRVFLDTDYSKLLEAYNEPVTVIRDYTLGRLTLDDIEQICQQKENLQNNTSTKLSELYAEEAIDAEQLAEKWKRIIQADQEENLDG